MSLDNYNPLCMNGECSISGRIYQDIDGSGVYSKDDIALGGVTVHYTNGTLSHFVISRSDGVYHIPNLPEGEWFLSLPSTCEGLLLSYVDINKNSLQEDGSVKVVLDYSNNEANNINFGYKGNCQLSGQVIVKKNHKFLGVADVSLIIMPIDNSFVPREVRTDHLGFYRVVELLPYEYQVFLTDSHPFLMLDDLVEMEVIRLRTDMVVETVIDLSTEINIRTNIKHRKDD